MDSVVDFITENYVWIIISAVVILMVIVGYIADKTDFGRKNIEKEPKKVVEKEKKVKEKKKKEKAEKPQVVKQDKEVKEVDDPNTTVNQPSFEGINLQNGIDELGVPTDNSQSQVQIDNSLFEPLPSIDQVFSNIPQDTIEEDQSNNVSDIPNKENESDDDIWKF